MKHTKQPIIPLHKMDSLSSLGLQFCYMEFAGEYNEALLKMNKNVAHRDDYYLFLFTESAESSYLLDFEEISVTGESLLYIRPGQVHFVSSIREAKGWSLAIDPLWMEDEYRNVFEKPFVLQKAIQIDHAAAGNIRDIAHALHTLIQAGPTPLRNRIVLNLANAFIGIIAERYALQNNKPQQHKSRSATLAYRFKELLSENFRKIKSPARYAALLNYSLAHVNESVKNATGFPVSYWIQQQVILEAKRLLYYTDLDVKEIAFALGYEDHAYFSRLFSKVSGISPLTFRRDFHK
ncbi:MAG: helix-turn-helix domain-containing protein [Tannerellaceae bacterium]|jgi:AraC-like DNA-binding protein|nr:helix-turn-helix domain-containing protein [Tannerellaceae bacterium]